jgi:hypothetical protein
VEDPENLVVVAELADLEQVPELQEETLLQKMHLLFYLQHLTQLQ